MMLCVYRSLMGDDRSFDLDKVYDVVLGYSGAQDGWSATLVYEPKGRVFIELRSSPPNYRGESSEEVVEVSADYIAKNFYLNSDQLDAVMRSPASWALIDIR